MVRLVWLHLVVHRDCPIHVSCEAPSPSLFSLAADGGSANGNRLLAVGFLAEVLLMAREAEPDVDVSPWQETLAKIAVTSTPHGNKLEKVGHG